MSKKPQKIDTKPQHVEHINIKITPRTPSPHIQTCGKTTQQSTEHKDTHMTQKTLQPGEFGKISVTYRTRENTYIASVRYRDLHGNIQRLRARGKNEQQARTRIHHTMERTRTKGAHPATLYQEAIQSINADLERNDIKKQTHRSYTGTLNCHLKNHPLATHNPARITPQQAENLIRHVENTAPSQARILRNILTRTYNRLIRLDLVGDNPFTRTQPPKDTPHEPTIFPFERIPELRHRIREWVNTPRLGPGKPDYFPDLIDLLLLTGIRIGEALALTWSNIELPEHHLPPEHTHADHPVTLSTHTHGALTISGTLLAYKHDGSLRQNVPKTSSSWRRLILPPTATHILATRYRLSLVAFDGTSPWVFPNRDGDHPVRMSTVGRNWRQARDDMGYPDLTFHHFRRTLATYLDLTGITTGGGLEHARRVLGHSSSTITERYYRARTADSVPDLSAHMENILRGTIEP